MLDTINHLAVVGTDTMSIGNRVEDTINSSRLKELIVKRLI